jgi:hypothetical protein
MEGLNKIMKHLIKQFPGQKLNLQPTDYDTEGPLYNDFNINLVSWLVNQLVCRYVSVRTALRFLLLLNDKITNRSNLN